MDNLNLIFYSSLFINLIFMLYILLTVKKVIKKLDNLISINNEELNSLFKTDDLEYDDIIEEDIEENIDENNISNENTNNVNSEEFSVDKIYGRLKDSFNNKVSNKIQNFEEIVTEKYNNEETDNEKEEVKKLNILDLSEEDKLNYLKEYADKFPNSVNINIINNAIEMELTNILTQEMLNQLLDKKD